MASRRLGAKPETIKIQDDIYCMSMYILYCSYLGHYGVKLCGTTGPSSTVRSCDGPSDGSEEHFHIIHQPVLLYPTSSTSIDWKSKFPI